MSSVHDMLIKQMLSNVSQGTSSEFMEIAQQQQEERDLLNREKQMQRQIALERKHELPQKRAERTVKMKVAESKAMEEQQFIPYEVQVKESIGINRVFEHLSTMNEIVLN